MASRLQKIQRARAFFKMQLTSLVKPVNFTYLSNAELVIWSDLMEQTRIAQQELLHLHDEQSRKMGLKVPEFRCWCGKEGKYDSEYEDDIKKHFKITKVCKKHIGC